VAEVDLERLRAVDGEPNQWLALGRGWQGDRFSPLTHITTDNVTRVGFAWESEARSRRGRVEHGQEATPIVVDGVLYVSGPWGSVMAVDAETGAERWQYDPEVDGSYARRACCDVVNRGVAVWRGRVYVATLDGYLAALDAATGRERWRVNTLIDRDTRSYTITGPPQVAKDVVVIGNSGAEFGVRGYITAYDLETGEQRWRFFTVPADPAKGPPEHPEMELALTTWDPNSDWESGLGGTVWGEMAYDPELNLLYVGTGNSSPYPIWYRSPAGGDNLFLVSILAINPDDGRLVWHYQQVPGEIWDYTATANMILADLVIAGRERQVIMQAPKNGFYYVLDRATGAFISAKPFVFVNWATGIDPAGRPILNPDAVYRGRPALVFPTNAGGHNWHPMAYSRQTGLTYIPAREEGMLVTDVPEYRWRPGWWNQGNNAVFSNLVDIIPGARAMVEGFRRTRPDLPSPYTAEILIAWDPVEQQERWRVPLGTTWASGGGVLTTAGNLVVQGTSSGYLVFYHAETGEKLHQIEVGTGIIAAPVSYEIDGVQYIAVIAGFGGALNSTLMPGNAAYRYRNYGRVLAFRLDGGPTPLPPPHQPAETPPPPPLDPGMAGLADSGGKWFGEVCSFCHGGRGEAALSAYPDLHRMTGETHAAFDSIVLGGKYASAGMASFADLLTPEQVGAIHAYLIREQGRLYAEEQAVRRSGTAPPG
jgi:quinohemoprotein ethanol dehydrogenase